MPCGGADTGLTAVGGARPSVGAQVLLVCPDFERCPTQQSVCIYFLEPGVEEALRSALAR